MNSILSWLRSFFIAGGLECSKFINEHSCLSKSLGTYVKYLILVDPPHPLPVMNHPFPSGVLTNSPIKTSLIKQKYARNCNLEASSIISQRNVMFIEPKIRKTKLMGKYSGDID